VDRPHLQERRVQEWAADRRQIGERDTAVRQDKAAGAQTAERQSVRRL
jgi:hypothetical protein